VKEESVKEESEVPLAPIVDEPPIGDAAKALEQAAPAGDLSSGGADTPTAGLEGDPASSIAPPSQSEKRGRGRPPGAGKPFEKKPRPRGDATLTARELENLRKADAITLLQAEQRKTKALEEKLEDARLRATISDVKTSEVIDDSLHEACGYTAEAIANMAAAKFGPAARISEKQKEQLATAWTRVAKEYLGEHAKYSPLAAALLATIAVAGEKYVDIQLAGGAQTRPTLVQHEG
jgi:hypothetical protein